jgi:hypothetical protein
VGVSTEEINNLLLDKKLTLDEGQTTAREIIITVLMETSSEGKLPLRAENKREANSEASPLSERDIRLLIILCSELVNVCAKVTGQIDPALGAMLAYGRDDIRFESKSLYH